MSTSDHAFHAQTRFGELRSAAHSLVGDTRWNALCELLTDWPEEHLVEVVIPYLEDLLRDDTSPRWAPEPWCSFGRRSLTGHPAFALVVEGLVRRRREDLPTALDAQPEGVKPRDARQVQPLATWP